MLKNFVDIDVGDVSMHWHVCVECKKMWRHSEKCAKNHHAHTCPGCHCLCWDSFARKADAQKELCPDWYHTTDPQRIVPTNRATPDYRVIAFLTKDGTTARTMKVRVAMSPDGRREELDYMVVLYDLLHPMDQDAFVQSFLVDPQDREWMT